MEVVDCTLDARVVSSCRHVERHLRLALSDWFHLLSRLALNAEDWLYGCEWWMKNVPGELDLPWAFESLSDAIVRPGMLDTLMTKVDQVCLSMDRHEGIDFPRSMHELRDSLKILVQEMRNAGMAV